MRRGGANNLFRRRGRRLAPALTLLELMLSIVLIAMVGLGVASMLAMVGAGASVARDARSALQRTHVAQVRLGAYIRPALALLQVDNPGDRFALWLHDDRPGGKVNLSELRLFEVNGATGELQVSWVEIPQSWTPLERLKADKEYSRDADFFGVFGLNKAQGRVRSLAMCDNVVDVETLFDTGKPRDAERFHVNLSVDRQGSAPLTTMLSFGLLNHTKPE